MTRIFLVTFSFFLKLDTGAEESGIEDKGIMCGYETCAGLSGMVV